MKIIHIFPYSVRIAGGHSNAIREFIACQRAAGLDVVGLSPLSSGTGLKDGILEAGIRELEFTNESAVSAEIRRLAEDGSTILHLHTINCFTSALAAKARKDGLAVALTSHGQLNVRSPLHALKKFIYLALCPSAASHAHGIHVLTRKELQRLRLLMPGFRGVAVALPHVIREGPIRIPTDSTANFEQKPFTVIHLGRLDVRTKGLDLLVEGFANSGLDQARLVLAGPDWNNGRAALEKLAAHHGCAARVEFPGAVYGDDKERLLASADLFIAASRWDAFNISLAEALLRGIPAVISEKLNLAPELSQAGAVMVSRCTAGAFSKAIGELSVDPIRRQTIAAHGKAWVKKHCSVDQVGTGFLTFYNLLTPSQPE